MYEDIVANTNLVFSSAEYTTDIIHTNAAFSMKRNNHISNVASSNLLCGTAFRSSSNKCESLLDLMHDKMDIDLSDGEGSFDNLSNIVDDED